MSEIRYPVPSHVNAQALGKSRLPGKLQLAPPPSQTIAVGQVAETDLAQIIAWAPKHRLVAQVVETDLSQPITVIQSSVFVLRVVRSAIPWRI